jgi:lipopolysaccharide transport system ATP-binding protein
MSTVISVENLSKIYRLGQIGTGTFSYDLKLWWAKIHGKPNPLLRIGETDHGNRDHEDLWALKDVSFTVKQGEVLGIIGKNGAGKSTLLKILSRVTAPTSGRIRVKGRIASLLEVGTGFHPELTGRENTYLNGAILGMSRQEIDRKFDEIIEFSGVGKFIDTPVKRYSSGMYVRLAFAVAAHLEPEILVVDEVLAVGDAEFQKKCLGKMSDVAQEGRTVLFVSHNMAVVQSLCSRGVLLKNGVIKINSGIIDVVNKYIVNVTERIESVDLSEREDRKAGELIRFKSIEFFDKNSNTPINSALSGQAISVKIDFENLTKKIVDDVNFGLAFYTSTGSFLFSCGSRPSGTIFRIKSGVGSVWCDIPKLPLNAGRVHYTAHCDSKNETLDNVQDAGYLDVAKGDYYGTGLTPASHLQGVFIDYSYRTED